MKTTKPFNVRMDDVTRYRLEQIRKDQGLNGAQLIRQLINQRWQTLYEGRPSCASGAPCCMPAVFIQNQGAAQMHHEPPPVETAAAKATAQLFPQEEQAPVPWSPTGT